MTHTYTITGMTCSGCAASVKRALASVPDVEGVDIDLAGGTAAIIMTKHIPLSQFQQQLHTHPMYRIAPLGSSESFPTPGFDWADSSVWQRASLNTLNCLIGCSLGDFGMVIFLQQFYSGTPMTLQMILATVAGLITSVAMETVLLKTREKFSWRMAAQTAFSMSFISMIAMELVMNATDFMITGGKAAFGNPMYWAALIVAMVAGFAAPLPYNYYKLKKFNKACH